MANMTKSSNPKAVAMGDKIDRYFLGWPEIRTIEVSDDLKTIKVGLKHPLIFKKPLVKDDVYDMLIVFPKNGYEIHDRVDSPGFFPRIDEYLIYVKNEEPAS